MKGTPKRIKDMNLPELEELFKKVESQLHTKRRENVLEFSKTCIHKWELKGIGRHGSDKGVRSYKCTNSPCAITQEVDGNEITYYLFYKPITLN